MAQGQRRFSAEPVVAGSFGDPPALVVAVRARAVDGSANCAIIAKVADAFAVRKAAVQITHGLRSRDKALVIAGDVESLRARRDELLGSG